MDEKEMMEKVKAIITSTCTCPAVGKHRDVQLQVDSDQLRMGIDVEMEHTDDPKVA